MKFKRNIQRYLAVLICIALIFGSMGKSKIALAAVAPIGEFDGTFSASSEGISVTFGYSEDDEDGSTSSSISFRRAVDGSKNTYFSLYISTDSDGSTFQIMTGYPSGSGTSFAHDFYYQDRGNYPGGSALITFVRSKLISGSGQVYNAADIYHLFDGYTYYDNYIGGTISSVLQSNLKSSFGTYTEEPVLKSVNVSADGSGTVNAISGSYASGTSLTAVATPNQGYKFIGWYSNNALVSSNSSYTFSVTSSINLVAKFTNETYKVNFDSNGGSTVSARDIVYGSSYGTLPVPTRVGHTFSGWKDANNQIVSSASIYTIAGNSTLKAQWDVNTYKVQFVNTGADATGASNAQGYNSSVSIYAGKKQNAFFSGWTVPSGNISLNDASSSNTTFTMPAGDVILQANWKTVMGASAVINNNFHSTYSAYYRDGYYDVDKNITLQKNMVDVYINLDNGDGSYSNIKTDDFSLLNAKIEAVGSNVVSIALDNYGYTATVEVKGYSASLSAIMQELGIAEHDYTALSQKIAEIKANYDSEKLKVQEYEEAIKQIQSKLNIGGISVTESATLSENLQRTISGVESALRKIEEYDSNTEKIKDGLNSLMRLYNIDVNDDVSLSAILTQISTLGTEITESLSEINELKSNIQDIKTLLNLSPSSDMSEVYNEIVGIKTAVDNIMKSLNLTTSETSITADLSNIKEVAEELTSNMNSIIVKLQLSSEAQIEDILGQIEDLYVRKAELESNLESISNALGYNSNAYEAITNIIDKILAIRNSYNTIASKLGIEFEEDLTDEEKVVKIIDKIDTLQTDLSIAQSELIALIENLDIEDDNITILEKIILLKNRIVELQSDIEKQKDELKVLNSDIADLQATKEELQMQIVGYQSQINTLNTSKEELQMQVVGYQSEISTLNTSIDSLQKDKDTLLIQAEALNNALEKIQQEKQVLTEENEKLSKRGSSSGSVIVTQSEVVYKTQSDIIAYESAVDKYFSESNGEVLAKEGYLVSHTGSSDSWDIKSIWNTNGSIDYVFFKNKDTGEIIMVTKVLKVKNSIEELDSTSSAVDSTLQIKTNSENVFVTEELKNNYIANLNSELVVDVKKEKENAKILYQIVKEDEDVSTNWIETNKDEIIVSDVDNARLYVKAVDSDGTVEIKKTSGFKVNTIGKYVSGITDGASYNEDVILNTTDEVKSLIVNGKIVSTGTVLSAQRSYKIEATLLDGSVKIANIRIDKIPPMVEGVTDKGVYDTQVRIRFGDVSGVSAILNGEEFLSASYVKEKGDYTLVVKDTANNTQTVNFKIK